MQTTILVQMTYSKTQRTILESEFKRVFSCLSFFLAQPSQGPPSGAENKAFTLRQNREMLLSMAETCTPYTQGPLSTCFATALSARPWVGMGNL